MNLNAYAYSSFKIQKTLLQIVDGNAKTDVSNRREPGSFCGEAEQPQTFISETSYVKVVFHTDNFTDQVSLKAQQNMFLVV